MSSGHPGPVAELADLVPRMLKPGVLSEVISALQSGNSAAIDGAWGSSCALCSATLSAVAPSSVLIVLPRIRDVDDVAEDIQWFLKRAPTVFPAWETLPSEHSVSDTIFGGRLRVLQSLAAGTIPDTIVTSLPALMQPVPSREQLDRGSRRLAVGDEIDLEDFLRWLTERGFERVTGLELPGEFSLHGGILDIFPPAAEDPLRFELFGDEIESIRSFDVESQRKLDDLTETTLTIVAPAEMASDKDTSNRFGGGSFVDSLPKDTWVVLTEPQELVDEARLYLDRLTDRRGFFSVDATIAKCTDLPSVTIAALGADSFETSCHLQVESVERFSAARNDVLDELVSVVGHEDRVLIACHNEGERARLAELLHDNDDHPERFRLAEQVSLCIGRLSRGFRLITERVLVISDNELFRRTELHQPSRKRKRHESRVIDSFIDLNPGDLVVHLSNGIGRYHGMKLLEKDDQVEEHLEIEFRDGVRVFVPVSLIHLVQKYVGAAKGSPTLSKLGSTAWAKKKKKVAEAVTDMASEMIRLQAKREARPGIASEPDSQWQLEFAAAFPYTETDDQLTAISELKQDMERSRPMDRLICGDVGYGKTEVSMRAAFKAVDNGHQVAVLVPTTVLAEQHYRTFCQRMAEFPVSIELLSRFRTKAETRKVLEKMEAGTIDIVIGTHRIVQKDIRFKNLGLLVIDEEQRFGVEAKEMLKHLRLEVDVLTLSATPIPRTLHMSLLGIRDISNLTTAPLDRLPIETRVCRFDEGLIRNAIVRELNRNGQVFFVHNRVHDIRTIADRVQSIVPEAKITIGHGQMTGGELESAMLEFISGRADILVATTIIESGLDIPNANTIFIHEANNYGLADLHQLRGRVGRYRNRAYCYLVLPHDKPVTPIAAKRLKAIEEFSELGAGFKIAMRDLEIRGAGSILGNEQSGHIASVGYELYCQLLENSVRQLKNEPLREQLHVAVDLPVSAFFPGTYIPPGRPKIEIYRRLSQLSSVAELEEFEEELRDRFGPVPEESQRLLRVRQMQIRAAYWKINDIRLEDGYARFDYKSPNHIRDLAAQIGDNRLRVVDARSAYLVIKSDDDDGDALLDEITAALSVGEFSGTANRKSA